ncbi:hypothetical protein BY996DRAFT_7030828 [Phakopsora pachyrhizi]|uniref:Expressed protein n=1 Tax=Phakopsora pachyrhizi TaxID=170000 RepID=A0AAV0AG32_PHAPC|nr:hypothetical protein BY996DRAFT_8217979 [Phakopsora pachyrhizi]KAI8455453.1 hypothetical protein BY996DRAFT_7030828 [Phakopsora pachyrhizi]CAH7666640.1 expressed protein [Phakopsora pachyrhizi]
MSMSSYETNLAIKKAEHLRRLSDSQAISSPSLSTYYSLLGLRQHRQLQNNNNEDREFDSIWCINCHCNCSIKVNQKLKKISMKCQNPACQSHEFLNFSKLSSLNQNSSTLQSHSISHPANQSIVKSPQVDAGVRTDQEFQVQQPMGSLFNSKTLQTGTLPLVPEKSIITLQCENNQPKKSPQKSNFEMKKSKKNRSKVKSSLTEALKNKKSKDEEQRHSKSFSDLSSFLTQV